MGLGLILLEGALRSLPVSIGPRLGNAVWGIYDTRPGGAYYWDPRLGMNLMWTRQTLRAYWNGYFWDHVTDERGFRNPCGVGHRLVIAGDSMVYGHGVEERDTVTARLRERGRAAYSLARQGDTLYQELLLLRFWMRTLGADRAVVTVFVNDFEDMLHWRTPEQIARASELSLTSEQADAERRRVMRLEAKAERSWWQQRHRSRAVRLLEALARGAGSRLFATAVAGADPLVDDEAFGMLADYYRRGLTSLARHGDAEGWALTVFLLDLGEAFGPRVRAGYDRLDALLRPFAPEIGAQYVDSRQTLDGCDTCFLPGDGHLTPRGHERVAALLDRVLPHQRSAAESDANVRGAQVSTSRRTR